MSSKHKALFFISVLIFVFQTVSGSSRRDSLENALHKAKADSIRISLTCELAAVQIQESPDEDSLEIIKKTLIQALDESVEKKYRTAEGLARYGLGFYYQKTEDFQTARPLLERAQIIFQALNNQRLESACYERLFVLHWFGLNDLQQGNYYARKVIERQAYLESDRAYSIYLAYFFLGSYQRFQYDLDSTQYYLSQAVAFGEKHQTRTLDAYVLLSYNYFNKLDFLTSTAYAHDLIASGKRKGSAEEQMWGWATVGSFHSTLGNHLSAYKAFAEATSIAKNASDEKAYFDFNVARLVSETYLTPDKTRLDTLQLLFDSMKVVQPCSLEVWLELSPLYQLIGQEALAMSVNDTLISYAEKCNTQNHMPYLLRYKADMLLSRSRYAEALDISRRAYQLALAGDDPYLSNDIRFILSRAEAAAGHFQKADQLYRQASALRDSIDVLRLQSIESLTRQLEQDQARVEILKTENALLKSQQQKKRLIIVLMLVGLLSIITLAALSWDRRRIQEQTRRLTSNLNIQLDELTEHIRSHAELLSDNLRGQVEDLSHELSIAGRQLNKQMDEHTHSPREKLKMLKEILNRQQDLSLKVQATALQKEEELRAFNYTISHDLKAPLGAAKNFVDLLEQQLELDTRQHLHTRNYIQHFRDLLGQMNQLIEGIAAYAYVDHEKIQPNRFEPAPLLINIIEEIRKTTPSAGQTEIVIANSLPTLNADRFLMRQVFTNLLSNAFKFSAPVEKPEIRIHGRHTEDFTEITIADNGVGIPPESQSRIFELFRTAHDRRVYRGTGAGLAIVKRIVERHGGKIWVKSAGVDKGTAFILQLPSH